MFRFLTHEFSFLLRMINRAPMFASLFVDEKWGQVSYATASEVSF